MVANIVGSFRMDKLLAMGLSCGPVDRCIRDSFRMGKCMARESLVIIQNLISNRMHFMRDHFY
jgi:hypothetical protein